MNNEISGKKLAASPYTILSSVSNSPVDLRSGDEGALKLSHEIPTRGVSSGGS